MSNVPEIPKPEDCLHPNHVHEWMYWVLSSGKQTWVAKGNNSTRSLRYLFTVVWTRCFYRDVKNVLNIHRGLFNKLETCRVVFCVWWVGEKWTFRTNRGGFLSSMFYICFYILTSIDALLKRKKPLLAAGGAKTCRTRVKKYSEDWMGHGILEK